MLTEINNLSRVKVTQDSAFCYVLFTKLIFKVFDINICVVLNIDILTYAINDMRVRTEDDPILVLTGVTNLTNINQYPYRPRLIINSIGDIAAE